MAFGNIVKLNVGGTVFMTTKATLTIYDGFFRGMFESGIPLSLDEAGCVFIDRCPIHFHVILNFMRDGKVALPDSTRENQEILQEAEYYCLEGLIRLCKGLPVEKFVIQNGSSSQIIPENIEFDHLTVDNADKNIILIQYGAIEDLVKSKEANCFVEKHKEKWNILFQKEMHFSASYYIHVSTKGTISCHMDYKNNAELFEKIESTIEQLA